ncbi:Hypothetical protein BSSP2_I0116 [Brucella suis bv. 2]|nr:hypothetical protein BCA52141_I1502 [Brucella canis HSK A52141]AIB16852.1 Hypothetical protein BSSP3_I0116 [Brucella suis bv. 2]AIB20227.1 Hypothetical protein BSPT1_I0117 [Brucella suis bv. 2]AIB26988.1 Hypothetical protein BSSP1_I0115 [Brucella suis bv. 2]AIB30352.1 Hypothetical protein BSSP2_I0116 [Brucella suis bv. 2]
MLLPALLRASHAILLIDLKDLIFPLLFPTEGRFDASVPVVSRCHVCLIRAPRACFSCRSVFRSARTERCPTVRYRPEG